MITRIPTILNTILDYKKRLNGVQRLRLELRPRLRPRLRLELRRQSRPRLRLEPSLGVAQKEPYENYAEKQENQEKQEKQELANKTPSSVKPYIFHKN
jgi:hypothetical protein